MTYQASITGSSGNLNFLTDFKLCDCPNILSSTPIFQVLGFLLAATLKKITFYFDAPKTISKIILYSTTDRNSNINKISISFNNTHIKYFGPLNNYGKATAISFDPQYEISEISISLIDISGNKAGFSEIEIFSDKNEQTLLKFIKIMVSNNFAYDYWIPTSILNYY